MIVIIKHEIYSYTDNVQSGVENGINPDIGIMKDKLQ